MIGSIDSPQQTLQACGFQDVEVVDSVQMLARHGYAESIVVRAFAVVCANRRRVQWIDD